VASFLSFLAAFLRRAWQFRSRHNSPRLARERDFASPYRHPCRVADIRTKGPNPAYINVQITHSVR
jgi:hypothetical protein